MNTNRMLGWLACCAFVCSVAAASPRQRLTKTQADQAVERIVGEWKDSERKRLDYVTSERKLRIDTLVMPRHRLLHKGEAFFFELYMVEELANESFRAYV